MLPVSKTVFKPDLPGPGTDSFEVLFGQNFRRRHDRRLIRILTGRNHCRHRNNCFAAAHIALQKPVHGGFFGHVFLDFANNSFLSFG